jgi:chemotaxis protein CheX
MEGEVSHDRPVRLETDGVVPLLPPILDLVLAKSLWDSLAAMEEQRALVLDAGEVERMSTPCGQVLLVATRAAEAHSLSFRIVTSSDVFRTALADLSLWPEFSKWMD